LAILFQPIAKIILSKNTWQIVDVVVAIFLIVFAIVEFFNEKRISENKS
jgi:arginine exporter protein ArgO